MERREAMAKQHISQALKKFIKEKIQTVLRLETLLLLHHQQTRSFTVAEVENELGFESASFPLIRLPNSGWRGFP